MPNFDVSLDCRNFAATPGDGYTNTTASNNAIYSYKYSGGTDGNGNVDETTNAGAANITVTIHADPRYAVSSAQISGDIESQLGSQPGASPTSIVITDTDTSTGSGYYAIIVADTNAGCTFPCDPRINHT